MSLAQEILDLGFKVTSDTGSYRLIRCLDGSQAALYSLAGTADVSLYTQEQGPRGNSGNLGNIMTGSPQELLQAQQAGLVLAQRILADQAARLLLPRYSDPSIQSNPYR